MKPGVVATIAIAASAVAGAVVVSRKPAAASGGGGSGGGPAPAPNPTPSVPSAADVLSKGLPTVVGLTITDLAPNGMIATAIISSDGAAVEISNAAPSGDFDLLRIGLQKSVGAPFPGLLVSKRAAKLYAQNVDLADALARGMDLNGASSSQLSAFQLRLVKGPSHMVLSIGMPTPGDPSDFLTSLAYGDDRSPMTKAQCAAAPDCSAVLDKRVIATFGIKSLFA
jgi:hypothetical protein